MRISFSLRAFVVYFLILAALSWFILDNAIERINVALRQSAESVLVDSANLLATSLEQEFDDQSLDTWEIAQLFSEAYQRNVNANIYGVLKERVDTEVYVTDREGIVVYDSTGLHTGEDYSEWRDVSLTLAGEYGARTSYRDEAKTEPEDEKIMVIAAPIRFQEEIVGVVSVVKPIRSLERFLLDESNALKRYAIGLLGIALILGYLVSHSFNAASKRLVRYANDTAAGRKVPLPRFLDKRFMRLAEAISNMRGQIDGKEYVEHYVHSLTHELKTPLTAIEASCELLDEDLPVEERRRFLGNIRTSNARMSRLVDRMLSLAKLEGQPEVRAPRRFDIAASIADLIDEREALIRDAGITIRVDTGSGSEVVGDPLLLQQAVANLIDNAIEFSEPGAGIAVLINDAGCETGGGFDVTVRNSGAALDQFVIDRAFDRFFSMPRGRGSGRTTKSTGLGLSFVHEIMKLHQGKATLENRSGEIVASLWWPEPESG